MSLPPAAASEIFSVREIAAAAGVSLAQAEALTGCGRDGSDEAYFLTREAVGYVRRLRRTAFGANERPLFTTPHAPQRSAAAGVTGSVAFHAGVLGVLALLTTVGLTSREAARQQQEPTRLVFLATPGPGGGGGGGGLRQPAPPRRAELKTVAANVKSPVPPPRLLRTRHPEPPRRTPPRPPVPRPTPRPADPPPPAPRPELAPQVVAPVVTASTDPTDRAGVLTDTSSESESQGTGSGSGAGTGQGSGIGEGAGAGIGPGSGGGTGGGPYRPGSGITPPSLLREVRPEYTEDARRRGITGDVVLEIVVRHDGSVGDVKVLQGLGGGLDRRAIDAVRQWRFSPARRHGTPVDVLVEVAVEFKLR